MSPLWTRDGHVLELAMLRAMAGEASDEERGAIDAHVAVCEGCRQNWQATAALYESPATPSVVGQHPQEGIEEPTPLRLQTPVRRWPVIVALTALAAGVLLVLRPQPEQFTARGATFQFEVWRHEGPGTRQLHTGDAVESGDRLGFLVWAAKPGHLQVLGQDGSGDVYLAWPAYPATGSSPYTPAATAQPLDNAIVLDGVPGAERLVAVFCDEPTGFNELATALNQTPLDPSSDTPKLRDSCAQAEVRLVKAGP